MFTEFLHPQLVLFGEFINHKIKIDHSVQVSDGQLVVHQRIQRRLPQKQNAQRFIHDLINNRQSAYQQDQQDYQRNRYQYDPYGFEGDQDYEDQEEYYDQQPYGQEQYAYGAEDEEVPQEIASIIHQAMLQQNQVKTNNKKIPFISSPNRRQQANKNKPAVPAQTNEEEEWETEEEEQDYVNAELEQAGGVFDGQLGQI